MNKAAVQWQVIQGIPVSKSNSYRIGKGKFYKSKAMTDYENSFILQCNLYRNTKIEGDFEFYIRAYFKNKGQDLDGIFKATLDILQSMGVISNDNRCVKIDAEKYHDAVNPRIEFFINELT